MNFAIRWTLLNKKSLGFIFIVLFSGTVIGSLLGELIGWIMPEGVVKQFFLTGVHLDLAGLAGMDSGVIVLNLIVITLKFGLTISLNFIGLVGLATSYYFLRYFR